MSVDAAMNAEALEQIVAKYAQPDPSTLSKLPKPTSRDNTKGKCDVCGGWHGLPAVHLDYMGHADVTLALIDVDPCWDWEPLAVENGSPVIANQGGRLVMWGYLTVLGKRMLCVGTCEAGKGDPEKELIGDLLRNGAMRFGIGTRLWSKADGVDPAGSGVGGGYDQRGTRTAPRSRGTARDIAGAADPNAATPKQLGAIKAAFAAANISERDDMLAFVANVIGREVQSSKEMSKAEASKVLEALPAKDAA